MYTTEEYHERKCLKICFHHQKKLILPRAEAPSLELKSLPKDLKYVFLGLKETFLVAIFEHLEEIQEEHLFFVCRMKGYEASCMHTSDNIKEDTKPSRQKQCKLNPTMK